MLMNPKLEPCKASSSATALHSLHCCEIFKPGRMPASMLRECRSAAAMPYHMLSCKQPIHHLQAKLSSAQASAQAGPDLGEVGPLLGKAASAYRRLYSSAAAAGLDVPYEANLNNVGSLVWLEQLMVRAQEQRVAHYSRSEAGCAHWQHVAYALNSMLCRLQQLARWFPS
jgi:hypothetical protein